MLITFSPLMMSVIADNVIRRAKQSADPDSYVVDQISKMHDVGGEKRANNLSELISNNWDTND